MAQGPTQNSDLSLEKAIHKSLENNYGIKVAKLNSEVAHMNDNWGSAGALPQVGVSVEATHSEIDMTEDPTVVEQIQQQFQSQGGVAGLNANWTIFDGMGMFAAKSTLELLASQSDNQTELIVEQTVEAVDFAYHNVLVQTSLLAVLTETIDLSRDRLDQIILSEEYGVAGTFDRLQFENAIISDSSAYLMQEVAVKTSMRNLNRLMGEEEDKVWILTSALSSPPALGDLQSLESLVASDNSLIKNANLTRDISLQSVKMAEARLYPVVGLGAGHRINKNVYSIGEQSLTGGNNSTAITLTINFNLFNGGATKRAISEAKINREIAELSVIDNTSEALKLVTDAYDKYKVNASIYTLSTRATENAKIALEIAEGRYNDGVVNSLDYRDLEVALQVARVSELQALQVWRASYVEVQRLIGALRAPLN